MNRTDRRFYLNRKFVLLTGFIFLIAGILVVMTNFSLNLITGASAYKSTILKWSYHRHESEAALIKYAATTEPSDYRNYLRNQREQHEAERTVDNIMAPDSDVASILRIMDAERVGFNEISSLILVSDWFYRINSIQRLKNLWDSLQTYEADQHEIARTLREKVEAGEAEPSAVKEYIAGMEQNRQERSALFKQLIAGVEITTHNIKQWGLGLSVCLGILLLLLGVVVTVRVSKSIEGWERALKEKDILLSEIHHRVKNNLAVISGMLELETMDSDNPKTGLKESRERIHSMAMIHEILYQSRSFSELDFSEYMQKLITYIRDACLKKSHNISIDTDIPSITLNINQAVPVALITSEILMNSLQHAFDIYQNGKICIKMSEYDGCFHLEIEDNGRGLPPEEDLEEMNSTGFTIIRALVKQVKGEISFKNGSGTKVDMKFLKSDAPGSSNAHL